MVSIRLPSEASYNPQHLHHSPRRSLLSPRLWRRIIPVLILIILAVESWRFLALPSAATSSPHASPPPIHPHTPQEAIDEKFDSGPPLTGLSHLVLVACHGIWTGGASKGEKEDEWVLESFQKGKGVQESFLRHIEAGVKVADEDGQALLMFGGGETRREAGPRSEAGSYFELAMARALIPQPLLNRTTTEIAALDSYQNLLFALCRFRELTGYYPSKLTVISYEFKRGRFETLHRRAVGFPETRFAFVGLDPRWKSEAEADEVRQGEHDNAVSMWTTDPYGCREGGLREKRRRRNWGRRAWGYELVCPEMRRLMMWCDEGGGEGEWFGEGRLPWSDGSVDELMPEAPEVEKAVQETVEGTVEETAEAGQAGVEGAQDSLDRTDP